MLVTNKRQSSTYENTQQVCTSASGDEVWCVIDPDPDCPPACRMKHPEQLLTADDWLRVTKKFRLSGKSIRRLKRVWAMGDTEFQTDQPKEQWAFHELEGIMLHKMKRHHRAKRGVQYLPFHNVQTNNNAVSNHLIIANTGAGKTRFCSNLLCRPNSDGELYAANRPIVCFSTHRDDPSMAPARKLHKKKWTDINFNKLDGRLSIDMLPRGCLVIFDDCLEIKSDFRSKVLYDLLTQIATVGRHHTSTKNIPTEFLCLTHHGSRRELATVRNAARFWTLFPRGSKQQCVHILKNRLQLGKKAIETLLNNCGNSRTATFDMHHPMKLISENHVELLD